MTLIAIADPYSSAHRIAPAFRARGVRAIALRTAFALPATARSTWDPAQYDHIIDATAPLDQVRAQLAELHPIRILPGSETGVRIADELTSALLPATGNVAALAPARHDKWQTGLAVAAAGLPALAQLATASAAELAAWRSAHGLDGEPIVLKPVHSAGADSVHLVAPHADAGPTLARILGGRNRMGRRDDVVLVQEFASGVEYAVDTYSADGAHAVVMISAYAKHAVGDRLGIYESVRCLPRDAPEAAELADYVRAVLDVVGLRNGSAHVEVMRTPKGPRLIEVNARTAGNPLPEMTRLATGTDQIDHCVRHVVDGVAGPRDYRLDRHVTAAFLSSPRTGVLVDTAPLEALADLRTCVGVHLAARSGERVERTVDVFTSIGRVLLAGDDPDLVAADYARVRAAERRLVVA
ncbi:ATP-grasp domain-containing protein [Actinokineospora sp. NPDC004072]